MARLHLSPPWVTLYNQIKVLFKEDPQVRVIYDELEYEVKLYVSNPSKAEALMALLPEEKTFGNVSLKITVVPPNVNSKLNPKVPLFEAAFENNPIVSYIHTIDDCGFLTNSITYIVFINEVVQFFNDDLGDINGNCSTLYQEAAKNVFGTQDGIFFCTDVSICTGCTERSLGKPLGEWP